MRVATLASLVTLAWALGTAQAQTSYPMITHTTPTAVQRGKSTEVTVEGRMNFAGAYKALIEGSGITAEVLAPAAAKGSNAQVQSVKLKVTVAPDAVLGVREYRFASALGLSSIGQLVIVDDPVVQESGDNNVPAKANAISTPSVVCGRIEAAEDVDTFKLQAEAGQALTVEILGARLEDKIHDLQKHLDPYVALFDAEGRELAANDDFYFADALFSYTLPRSGAFYLQVRDSKYDGDPRWVYALLVTTRPHVTHVYPMAGNPKQKLNVEPVGSAGAAAASVSIEPPAEPGIHPLQLDVHGIKTNPAAFLVTALPQVREHEPNDTPEQATSIPIPSGVNGRIGVKRDLDHFRFTGVKGKAIRFEVQARRFNTLLRSSLDSVLDVMNPKGVVLANNDDLVGKDAGLVFTPPADGEYLLRIRDLNSKGGPTGVYFIEADWATPDFTLRCDPDKAMIGPGSSTAWYVHVVRANGFTGPVRIDVQGLPRGVTVSPLTIPPTMNQGVLVLTADPEASRDATQVKVVGTATIKQPDGKEENLVRTATANQEIYSPGGGRARIDVNLQAVAVTDPSDILKVNVSKQAITLKPGEEVRIDVTLERRKDYDKSVSLDVLLRHLGGVHGNPLPPGVTMVEGKSKTLLGTSSQGHIVLKAAADAAPIEKVPISVLTHVSINFVVKVSYSSPPILLTVKK